MRALKWLHSWIGVRRPRLNQRGFREARQLKPPYRPQAEILEDRLVPALFGSPITQATGGNAPFAVVVDDFNGDGRADIAVSNFNSGTLSVGLGNGNGTFSQATGSPFNVGASAGALAAADFNGDGREDIAVADPNDSRVVYFFGGTAFVSSIFNLSSAPLSMAAADFNHDGFADLAMGLQNGDVRVIFGASTIPGFSNQFVASGPGPVTALVTGDFNNDGNADIAAVRETSSGTALSIYFGNGHGAFSPGPFITMSATRATGMVAADFLGTGQLDVAIANFTNNTITVVVNDGGGTFETPRVLSVLGNPFSLVAADFNRDGRVDLVKSNNANNTVTPLIGNGDGTFVTNPTVSFSAGVSPKGMAIGDFNNDGLPDLVVDDSSTPGQETVLLNTNRTHFNITAPFQASPGASFSVTVTALDNFGSIQTGYRGTVAFSSTDPKASLPASYTFNASDAGVHTFTVTLFTGGSQNIIVNDTSDITIRNFTTVSVINPQPSVSSLSVTTAVEGSDGFDLTVNGSNFVPTSVVKWNGMSLTTTFISSMQLSASVPSSDLAEEGTFQVTVVNPPPGGGTAGPLDFIVTDAALTLTGRTTSGTEGIQASFLVATLIDDNPVATISDFTSGTGSISIMWGDGTSSSGTVTQPGGVGTAFFILGTHTYSEEGSYSTTMSVMDTGGSMTSGSGSAVIGDASLSLSVNPIKVTASNSFTGQVATFTDANPLATTADFPPGNVVINWGDGVTDTAVVSQSAIGMPFVVTGSHTYLTSDFHVFTVTVTDVGGSTASGKALAGNFQVHDIAGRVSQTGQWWVAQSNGSNAFNNALWDTWNPNVTWVDVVTGDFNGDGKTDIAGRVKETGQWWVALSNGNSFTTTLWTTWSTTISWVDVKVGNFTGATNPLTGDPIMSIAGRVKETGQWWVAQSNRTSFTNNLWTTWSTAVTWVDVNVGDFTGDGKADIAGRTLESGQWWVAQSNSTSFTNNFWDAWSTSVTWVDVNVGDFNGDKKADIAGRALELGQWWVGLSTGSSFNTTFWGQWSTAVTWVDVKIGDFNGDGSSDIIGRSLQSGQWWVAYSNGSNAFTNFFFAQWSRAVAWADVQVGDFNADGRDDIAGRDPGTGIWWTALSNGTTAVTTPWTSWSTSITWVGVHSGVFV